MKNIKKNKIFYGTLGSSFEEAYLPLQRADASLGIED